MKIEKALAGLAVGLTEGLAAEERARAEGDAAVAAGIPRIAVGTYTGDGVKGRVIAVGFTPRAVFVFPKNSRLSESDNKFYLYGGLAVTGGPVMDYQDVEVVAVQSGGFRVTYEVTKNSWYAVSNMDGLVYHYVALG